MDPFMPPPLSGPTGRLALCGHTRLVTRDEANCDVSNGSYGETRTNDDAMSYPGRLVPRGRGDASFAGNTRARKVAQSDDPVSSFVQLLDKRRWQRAHKHEGRVRSRDATVFCLWNYTGPVRVSSRTISQSYRQGRSPTTDVALSCMPEKYQVYFNSAQFAEVTGADKVMVDNIVVAVDKRESPAYLVDKADGRTLFFSVVVPGHGTPWSIELVPQFGNVDDLAMYFLDSIWGLVGLQPLALAIFAAASRTAAKNYFGLGPTSGYYVPDDDLTDEECNCADGNN